MRLTFFCKEVGLSVAFKSGIWYTISNFLVKGIAFLTTPIFTRILTKSDFGLYNNYISWLAIVTTIVTLNLNSTLISARYDFKNELDEYILSILSLSSVSVLTWLFIVNFFSDFFVYLLGMDLVYINSMLIYLLFLPAVTLFQSKERYLFEYKKTVATSLFVSLGASFLSVLLVIYIQDKLAGRVIGTLSSTILLGFCLYIYFIKKGKKVAFKYWIYAIPISLPYIPHLLSLTVLNSTDRVMITRWSGAEAAAVYSLAYTCGTMITLLITSMNGAFAPWLGEMLNKNCLKEIRLFSNIYILFFFFLAIGVIAFTPEILLLLGGSSYYEAIYIVPPIAIGCVFQFLYILFVNVEQFKKKTIGMAIASLIAALVNFILNYIYIPKFGYLVAAYTTLFGYFLLLCIHMYLVKLLNLEKIYNYKLIFLVVFLGIIATFFMIFLFKANNIRYLFVFVYFILLCCLFFKYKNYLFNFKKLIKE